MAKAHQTFLKDNELTDIDRKQIARNLSIPTIFKDHANRDDCDINLLKFNLISDKFNKQKVREDFIYKGYNLLEINSSHMSI